MSFEKVIKGNTVEEIAKAFSDIVARNYLEHLEFWQATAMDDPYERKQWEVRIETEPEVVKKNAYAKILKIMKEPEENKSYYKKKWLFMRSKDEISITKSSEFYEDLLPEKDNVKYGVAVNVKYIIDKSRLTISEIVY